MSREKKVKEPLTVGQIYKRNKTNAKVFTILASVAWYLFLSLTILFFCLTVRNSVGNVTEILELLDEKNYTGAQLEQNYAFLVDKWGEWEIIEAGSAGLAIRYVDVGNALFSDTMITFSTLTIASSCVAFVFGKIMFPLLAKHFKNNNDEMVDMVTPESVSQIDQVSKKEEWF